MRAWLIATDVGEVEVLRNEKSSGLLRSSPDGEVVPASESFLDDGVYVVSEICEGLDETFRKVLVQFDLHCLVCPAGTGRSS
jgi:hypothetical protein